jgi:hypothetical protein
VSAVAQTSSRQDANVLSGEPPATPAQFLRWLHGDLRHRICIVRRIDSADDPGAATFRDHTIHRDDLPWQLQCPDVWLESPDTYVMINETRRQRLASDVVCLKAFVVDLDCHQADDLEPEAARDQALARLDAAGLPRPHLCVETGRGVQLIWRLGRVGLKKAHRNAQVRWAKTQQALARICGPQADLSLVDLPRVIRLPGTVNTKATPVRRVTHSSWVAGASAADYSFDELCDVALGIKRRSFVAAYVRKQADNDEAPISATGAAAAAAATKPARKPRSATGGTAGFESLATIAAARLRDLEKIAERFFMSGIPEGYRDIFIMAVATDLSWVTPLQQADAFSDLVIHRLKIMGAVVDERTHGAYLGRINAPLSVTEARRSLGSVVQRFRDAAAGAKVEFGGQLRDPRYWYGTERKWSLIGPMIVDDHELLGRLEELLPRHLRQARQEARRAAGGPSEGGEGGAAVGTAHAARDRVADGRYRRARPTDAQRDQALAELDQGLDMKAAAALAGVTARTIYNWVARRDVAAVGPCRPPLASAAAASPAQTQGPAETAPPDTGEREVEPAQGVKKRPSSYMAKPGDFPPEKSKTVLGFGLPATDRCGQPLNSLAGDRLAPPRGAPQAGSRVVHATARHGQGRGMGAGAGNGRALGATPAVVSQTVQLPGVSGSANYLPHRGGTLTGHPASIGDILAALASKGRLPQRPDGRKGAGTSGAGVAGARPVRAAGSGEPRPTSADGLAEPPPVAENDEDFGPTYPDDR